MAKTKRKAGKRATVAGHDKPRARKSGVPKTRKPGPRKPKPTKPAPRKRKPSLPSETARLKRRLKTARMQQQASADILRAVINASGDAARPLQQIAEITARLFGAPSVSIQLAEDGGFTQEYRVGAIAQRIGSAYPRSNIRVGGPNMPGTVVFENRQIHIPDLDHLDPSMSDWPGLPHARAGGCRTLCGTPLRREGEAIGALMIFRDRLLPFTDDELALQQSFADQAAIAIENARLFDEVQTKTRDLSEALVYQTGSGNILKVIASSPADVGPVLKAIVESACDLCEAYDAAVYLKDGGDLHPSAHHGPIPLFPDKLPIGRNWATGRAFLDRKPVHVHDFLSAEGDDFAVGQDRARRLGFRSVLCVPLLREGESIGIIVLRRSEVHPFSDKQIALLQTFADQAVIAISNVRLFEQVQERTRDLTESLQQQTATADVLKVISASPGELEPVFQAMLANAVRLCEAKFAMLFLYEEEENEFRAAGKWNLPPAWSEFLGKNTIRADPRVPLALQLPICFEVRALSGSLVSSTPE
jgi:two-component system NtrC family sensor kinase